MQFDLHLDTQMRQVHRIYNPELDDVRSILIDVCGLAGDHGTFTVSGFGQDQWPVDIRTDLAVLLEQLPEVIKAITSQQSFAIDFYEQGVRRKLSFSPQGDSYIAECMSFTTWRPNPSVEQIDRATLLRMLTAVQDEFMRFMRTTFPDLPRHPWVQSWLEGKCNYLL